MKKEQPETQDPSSSMNKTETETPEKEFMYVIPPGVKFNDIYMDVSDIYRELGYKPRTIYNMRDAGKLSTTTLNGGKPLFFRQEIAATLKENTEIGKKSIWHKSGIPKIVTAIAYLLSFIDF